jgi:hypothetical protein
MASWVMNIRCPWSHPEDALSRCKLSNDDMGCPKILSRVSRFKLGTPVIRSFEADTTKPKSKFAMLPPWSQCVTSHILNHSVTNFSCTHLTWSTVVMKLSTWYMSSHVNLLVNIAKCKSSTVHLLAIGPLTQTPCSSFTISVHWCELAWY